MELTYYATHIRFSPWLIGVFGGYILHQSRKRSIRIPRVNKRSYFKSIQINSHFFYNTDSEFIRMDCFIGFNVDSYIRKLSFNATGS